MEKKILLLGIAFLALIQVSFAGDHSRLFGHWKGLKISQDGSGYKNEAFFLPNDGEMILTEDKVKVYYYPFFKSAEFGARYTDKSIYYTINGKQIKNNYSFSGDTLVFEMHYINKVFLKMFVPMDLDEEVVEELDTYGFRTNKLIFEFELDTMHPEERNGFESYDSLGFTPFQHLQFKPNNTLIVNRDETVVYAREFKRVKFDYKGKAHEFEILHLGGTQSVLLIPISECECDSISIPYMSVVWANRVRQAIIDEENF